MKNKGFTLVELMVVLVIIAILTALVIPKFVSHHKDNTRHHHYSTY